MKKLILAAAVIGFLVYALIGPVLATPYTDSVVSFTSGSGASGSPASALGAPDYITVSLGLGGQITLRFVDNLLINGPGNDLRIDSFPPGSGSRELDNKAQVLLSTDGVSFTAFSGFIGPGGPSFFLDLSTIGFTQASFVRIVDSGSCCLSGNPSGGLDGFTIDSVEALNSAPVPEPGTLFLLGSGLAGVAGGAWRRRRR